MYIMSRYSLTKEEYYFTFYCHRDSNEPDILFTITNPGTTNYTSIPTIAISTGVFNLGTGMTSHAHWQQEKSIVLFYLIKV